MSIQALRRFGLTALIAMLAVLVTGCEEDDGSGAKPAPAPAVHRARSGGFDMGRGVVQVVGKHSSGCMAAVVMANKAKVIAAVNAVLPGSARGDVKAAIEGLFPMIDDGTLPRLVTDVKGIMRLLAADTEVLEAIVKLSKTSAGDTTAFGVNAIGQLLNYPELDKLAHALGKMLEADDGRLVDGLLALITSLAGELGDEDDSDAEPTEETAAQKSAWRAMVDELLREIPGITAGPAVTIKRLDENGVAVGQTITRKNDLPTHEDGASSTSTPDDDYDVGLPDAGGGTLGGLLDGIDWSGSVSDWINDKLGAGMVGLGEFLGGGTTYSDRVNQRPIDRRDPSDNERELKPTIQMNKTVLAALMRSGGEAIRLGLHADVIKIVVAALGPRQGDGFDAFNPLAQNQFGMLELLKYEHAPKLLDALAMTLDTDPELGEALIAKLLKLVRIIQETELPEASGAPKNDDGALLKANLKLIDQMFRVPAGQTSAGRELFNVITKLGQVAKDIPKEFASMFHFRTMVRGNNGDGNLVDEAKSEAVDRSKPPTYVDGTGTTIDNRSSFERLAALLNTTHNCIIPVIGKSLAYIHMELLAELTPESAVLIHDLFRLALQPGPIGDLVCKDADKHKQALIEFTNSGALDAIIPVIKIFKDRKQIPLFIDLMRLMHHNYDQIRPQEEMVIKVLNSGALEVVFDLLSLTTAVKIPGTTEVTADVLADFLADLLDHSKPAINMRGEEVPAKVFLLLDPMEAMTKALENTPGEAALEHLLENGIDVFLGVKTNDAGTPDDTSDDFDEVENPYLVPLLARLLQSSAAGMEKDPVKRREELTKSQQELPATFQKKALGDLVELLQYYCDNEHRKLLDDALAYALTPHDNPDQNLFGSLLGIIGSAIQVKVDGDAMTTLLKFVGKLMDPERGYVQNIVGALVSMGKYEHGAFLLGIIRNTFKNSHAGMGGESPASLMVRLMNACGSSEEMTVAGLRRDIDEMLRYGAIHQLEVLLSLVSTRNGGTPIRMNYEPGTFQWYAAQRKYGNASRNSKLMQYKKSPHRR